MDEVFADTSHFVALFIQSDPWRVAALSALRRLPKGTRLVTTYEVLIEFLSFVAGFGDYHRREAVRLVRYILSDRMFLVVGESSRAEFLQGLELYAARLDKEYSLVDCISMAVARERGIREVLTNDHHFEQEGFVVLIRSD